MQKKISLKVSQDVINCVLLYKLTVIIYNRYSKFCQHNSILEEKVILL